MAERVIVGQIAAKVVPDTKDFPEDLRKDLVRIEKRLRVKIPAELVGDSLELDARKAVRALNGKAASNDPGLKIKLKGEVDFKGLERQMRDLARQFSDDIELDVDTDRAQRDIERLEHTMESTRLMLAEPITIDTRQMINDVERATDRIDRELRDLGRQREIDLRVQADLDRSRLDRELNALGAELSREHDLRIGTKGAERALRNLGSDYDKLSDKMKSILAVDWLNPYEAIKLGFDEHDQREFTRFIDEYDGENIELQADLQKEYARAQLMVLTRTRVVDLLVHVKESSVAKAEAILKALSGWRMLDATVNNLRRLFENLDKNVPLIGSISLAVAGLSAWLLAAASNGFALAQSLAQMFQAGLLLPGLLIGIGLGLGATVAVLKDFNSVFPEVGKMFGNLQDEMSNLFWAVARGPMKDMIDTIFPQFSTGLKNTSIALGGFFGALANGIREHVGGSMPEMFGYLSDSIHIASLGVDSMSRTIEILGRHGASYLPRLAHWFTDINDRFADWLERSEESGKLTEWIEEGIFEIREFGRALGGAGSILAGFGRAAEKAGGSTLTILADRLNEIADIVNREPFQSNLVNVFTAAHQAMDVMSEKSGPAFSAMMDTLSKSLAGMLRETGSGLGSLIEGLSTALGTSEFNSGLLTMFSGLRQGIENLMPMWAPLGEAIGAIGSLLGTFFSNFGTLLATLLTQLSELAARIGPALEPVITNLSGMLNDLLINLGPAISEILGFFIELAAGIADNSAAVAVLAGAFLGLKINGIITGLVASWALLAPKITKAAAAVKIFIASTGPIGLVATAIVGVVTGLAAIGSTSITATKDAVRSVDGFTQSIEKAYGQTSELVGEVEMCVDPASKLDALFHANTGAGWVTEANSEIRGLSDALHFAASSDFDSFMFAAADGLGMGGDKAAYAKEMIGNFDQSLSNMVRSGNIETATAAAEDFRDVAEQMGLSTKETDALLGNFNTALAEHVYAQEKAAQAAIQGRDAVLSYETSLADVNAMSPQLIDSINETSKSFIDLSTDVDEAGWSVDSWLTSLEQMVEAQTNWADNLVALRERGVSDAVIAELDRMGVEGAPLVANLVNATDEEMARLEEVVRMKAEGAAGAAGTAFGTMSAEVTRALEGLPDTVKKQLTDLGVITFDESGKVASQVAAGMDGKTGEIKAAGDRAAAQLAAGFTGGMPGAVAAATNLGNAAVGGLWRAPMAATATAAGTSVNSSFAFGLLNGTAPVDAAGVAVGNAAIAGLDKQIGSGVLTEKGKNIVDGLSGGITSNIPGATTATESMGSQVVDSFAKKLGIHSPSTVFRDFGSWIVAGLSGGISANAGSASTSILGVATNVINGFTSKLGIGGGSSSVMRGFGLAIPGGLAGGIGERVSSVVGAMSNVQGKVKIDNPGSVLAEDGRVAIRGFNDAIIGSMWITRDVMSRITGYLYIPGAGSALVGAGYAVINGFVSALQSGFGRVRATLNSLTSMLPAWKGPPSTDRNILVNAGHLVIDGFISGLEDRFSLVRKSLASLTGMVADTEFSLGPVDGVAATKALNRQVRANRLDENRAVAQNKTLNYYAAPGASLDSEEDLLAASQRTRMVGW